MGNYISLDEFAKYLADIQYGEAPTGRTGENIDYQNGVYAGFDMAYVALKRFPAADVVEVVRCKDCKHSDTFSTDCTEATFPLKCLSVRYGGVFPHWFCEHGERNGGADDA